MIFPEKLSEGDTIHVIAPSYSLRVVGQEALKNAQRVFEEDLRLSVTFGSHTNEINEDNTSSLSSRLEDFHEAFADTSVDAVISVLGGYHANSLLPHIDWDTLAAHPKPMCGFSDITCLQAAALAKTGLVSYASPNYSAFGQRHLSPYTVEYFKKSLFESTPFDILPAEEWSDDPWHRDQANRLWIPNEGPWVIQEGSASGTVVGTTLSVLNSLQGTDEMPIPPGDTILALEDHDASNANYFERDLESLFQGTTFKNIVGVLIGRFQKKSHVSRPQLERLVERSSHLREVPVIANVDFGHTDPTVTLPIGGQVTMQAGTTSHIRVDTH